MGAIFHRYALETDKLVHINSYHSCCSNLVRGSIVGFRLVLPDFQVGIFYSRMKAVDQKEFFDLMIVVRPSSKLFGEDDGVSLVPSSVAMLKIDAR